MESHHLIIQVAVLVVVAVASVIDLRTTKIPNWLTFGSALVGIILNFALIDSKAGLFAMAGWVVGAVGMVLFKVVAKMDKMGMGDAKLIAAIGAFIGLEVLIAWGYFALLFGMFATFKFLTAIPWSHFATMVKSASMGVPTPLEKEAEQKLNAAMKKPIALAPIIAVGTLLAVALEKPTLQFLGFPTP